MMTPKFFMVVFLTGMMVLAGVINTSAGDVEKININTASAEELARLTGIGPNHAAGIIEFREKNGPFKNPEELLQVSGIGPKTFEKNKALILVEDLSSKPSQP